MCGCAERRAVIVAAAKSGDAEAIRQAAAFVVTSSAADIKAAVQTARVTAARRLGLVMRGR